MKPRLILPFWHVTISIAILLSACSSPATQSPTALATSTKPILPTMTIEPTLGPTQTPTFLPSPTNTPAPWGSSVITKDNVSRLIQLNNWGRGRVENVAPANNSKTLIVQTPLGVYLYENQGLNLLQFVEDASVFLVSPDSRLLATGHPDSSVKIWDTIDGTPLKNIIYTYEKPAIPYDLADFEGQSMDELHKLFEIERVSGLAFSPDNLQLAVSYGDATIHVWDLELDQPKTIIYNDHLITAAKQIAFSPDMNTLIASNLFKIFIFDVSSGKLLSRRSPEGNEQINQLSFSHDGTLIALLTFSISALEWRINLRALSDNEKVSIVFPELDEITDFRFSDDDQAIIVNGFFEREEIQRTLLISDSSIINEEPIPNVSDGLEDEGHYSFVSSLKTLPDRQIRGTTIIDNNSFWLTLPLQLLTPAGTESWATCKQGVIQIGFKDGTSKEISVSNHPNCDNAQIFPNEKIAAVWTNNRLSIVATTDGIIQNIVQGGHQRNINRIAFSEDGKFMASGSVAPQWGTSEIIIWQIDPILAVGRPQSLDTGDIRLLNFSPDNTILATAGSYLRMWSVPDGEVVNYDDRFVTSLAISPDSKLLAAGGNEGEIYIYELQRGQRIAVLTGQSGNILDLLFTPDGLNLVSCSSDGTVILWGIRD